MTETSTQPAQPGKVAKKRIPAHCKAGLAKLHANTPMGALSESARLQVIRQVVDEYLTGKEVAELAQERNLTDGQMYRWLLRLAEDDWKAAKIARSMAYYDQARKALDEAPDALSLARAREQLRSAQWELERLLARIFGVQNQQLNVAGEGITINIGFRRDAVDKSDAALQSVDNAIPGDFTRT